MNCDKTKDLIHYYSGENTPLLIHLQIALHLFFCPDCTRQNELLETSRELFTNDFFPPAPNLEKSIMNLIAREEIDIVETQIQETQPACNRQAVSKELSFRGWIIIGIIILVSLVSAFFGLEFNNLAHTAGISFLLPVGITVGIVLTSYGALFIASHLKELSKRFRL